VSTIVSLAIKFINKKALQGHGLIYELRFTSFYHKGHKVCQPQAGLRDKLLTESQKPQSKFD
jgi:hypothetical protein